MTGTLLPKVFLIVQPFLAQHAVVSRPSMNMPLKFKVGRSRSSPDSPKDRNATKGHNMCMTRATTFSSSSGTTIRRTSTRRGSLHVLQGEPQAVRRRSPGQGRHPRAGDAHGAALRPGRQTDPDTGTVCRGCATGSAEEKVPVVDLNAMSLKLYTALGAEKSTKAFVHYPANTYPGQDKPLQDNTHHNAYGGYELRAAWSKASRPTRRACHAPSPRCRPFRSRQPRPAGKGGHSRKPSDRQDRKARWKLA